MKKEEISKNLDYCLPFSLQKDKLMCKQWDMRIMLCFEQLNVRDLTIEEAQEQFLTLISSYRNTFGSYFIVRRKPHGMFNVKTGAIAGINPMM